MSYNAWFHFYNLVENPTLKCRKNEWCRAQCLGGREAGVEERWESSQMKLGAGFKTEPVSFSANGWLFFSVFLFYSLRNEQVKFYSETCAQMYRHKGMWFEGANHQGIIDSPSCNPLFKNISPYSFSIKTFLPMPVKARWFFWACKCVTFQYGSKSSTSNPVRCGYNFPGERSGNRCWEIDVGKEVDLCTGLELNCL